MIKLVVFSTQLNILIIKPKRAQKSSEENKFTLRLFKQNKITI